MVYELYKSYVHPLARVVRGLPTSWGPDLVTTKHRDPILDVAWSSCSRFVAIGLSGDTKVLDAATLARLHTFMHPRSDGGCHSFSPDSRSLTWIEDNNGGSITWDLQTGGRISAIPSIPDMFSGLRDFVYPMDDNMFDLEHFSSTYSMDGSIVAVACRNFDNKAVTAVYTYNLISGTHTPFHRVSDGQIVAQIWTHGEFLRFATVKPGSITIWEVGFTSEHTPEEIESLPAPDDVDRSEEFLFLPTLSRLALVLQEAVLIWDARDSKFLLNFMSGGQPPEGPSFSPDGRFFACAAGQGVHLWKESPTGYVLLQKLAHSSLPFLSPDGESCITATHHETQLWRTTGPINPPSSVPPRPSKQNNFVLAFSPDKSLIATGRSGGNIATILGLKSGDLRLIIDTDIRISCLGVTGSTAIVVGEGKIITWNLPAGDCVPDATAKIHDSVRTVILNNALPASNWLPATSISPDSNYLVIARGDCDGLDIYDTSTGKHLVGTTGHVSRPWFSRDGREVWYSDTYGQKIIRDGESNIIGLEPVWRGDGPSGGKLWVSSYGHRVTDDGWIIDSRKNRVVWLPHQWRFFREYQIWDERFLALCDSRLPEPVIIELYE